MRLALHLAAIFFATACGSTTLRYVPLEPSLASPPVAQSELTEATEEALLAEGWARVGWIYRHSSRGNERSGTDEMLLEAARRGGERLRIASVQRSVEEVSGTVVSVNSMGGYYASTATGRRGHIRRIGELWRRDPALAQQQLAVRARWKPDPVIAELSARCEASDASACHALAEEHHSGRRAAKGNEGWALEQRACALGAVAACRYLARNGFYDLRRAESRPQAIESAERGCAEGDPICCEIREHLVAYERGADDAAHARATELGLRWCEEGDASACRFAGSRFAKTANGAYGPTDEPRAALLYRRAEELARAAEREEPSAESFEADCAQGIGFACYQLGLRSEGDPRAVELLDSACEAGIGDACMRSAYAWDEGRGVPIDRQRAAALRARGCAIGDSNCCSSLEER